ncbi:MAG: phospholipase D-like domain-containing protein [Bythopirellula sp.]|nr:phospholipase D-like domain-containing protein [Bythopirellula sp.]
MLSTFVIIGVTALVTLFATLIFRNLATPERKLNYQLRELAVDDPTFERCMAHLLGPPLVGGNRVTTLLNGDEIFPAMLAAIRNARTNITFETYIYWSGKIGQEFVDALSERARSGIRVHVLLDWLGSNRMSAKELDELRQAGVEVERYRPLSWYSLSRMNSRTHRKILVVDGRIGFIGGVGIADQWSGHAQDADHWRDTHYRVEGPVVAHLQAAFTDNWLKTHANVLNHADYFPELKSVGDTWAQVFKSSPREGGDSARLMFLLSLAAARQRILIANSYFVPDDRTSEELITATRRGVRVEVIVPGSKIDTAITRRASRSQWGPLLAAGIEIHEYQPTMFHCKVMVIDDRWVSVGSANFDNRSFRLNDEANLNVMDRKFAEEQAIIFEQDKHVSRQVTYKEWQKRPWPEKIIENLAGLLRSQV